MFSYKTIATGLFAVLCLSSNVDAFTTSTPLRSTSTASKNIIARNMIDLDLQQFTTVADSLSTSSNILADAGAVFEPSYSKASYYTVLGLYVMSFPGIWSQIKRSTKAKVKRKTYISDGEAVEGGKDLRQQAGEIMACKSIHTGSFDYVDICLIGRRILINFILQI